MDIHFKGKIEKFWKYRTAYMRYDDIYMEVDVTPKMYGRIDRFLKSNGYVTDNHICWKIGSTYFMLTDNILRISDRIKEGDW